MLISKNRLVIIMIFALIAFPVLLSSFPHVAAAPGSSPSSAEDPSYIKQEAREYVGVTHLTATNEILTIEYNTPTGQYSILTGSSNPSPNQRIFFPVGTGFDTVRVTRADNSCADYTTRQFSPSSTCTVVLLGQGTREDLVGVTNPTGFKTTWHVTTPDLFTIEEIVNIHGTTVADSSVEVTMKVTNNDPTNNLMTSFRFLHDLTVDGDDGPLFTPKNPDGTPTVTETSYSNPAFEFFNIQDNIAIPSTLLAKGTVTGPSSITPTPTTPSNLVLASWPDSEGTAFDYTPTGLNVDGDNAVLYYYNNSPIGPGNSVTQTHYIFGTEKPGIPNPLDLQIIKFLDLNANGFQDQGEVGLSGWHMKVTDSTGSVVCEGDTMTDNPSTPQDESGTFLCTAIDTLAHPTPYTVQETVQQGFVNTTPNPQTITPFSTPFLVSFGNVRTAEIDGMKWNDLNGDGIKQQNELGVAGVDICVSSNQEEFATLTGNQCVRTDNNGNYVLGNLRPGSYRLFEIVPQGKVQTFPQGNYFVTLQGGQTLTGKDFGNAQAAEIHGMKWFDLNGNGIKDNGEVGSPGIEIDLFKLTFPDTIGSLFLTTSTDSNGDYSFTNLPPGDFRVAENQFGASQTFPTNGQPYFMILRPGDVKLGIDFGNTVIPPGAIAGMKWNDLNGDGIEQQNEPGVPGIIVCISSASRCTTTDTVGHYQFDNVPTGTYIVSESRTGSVNTTPWSQQVTVASGVTSDNVNFGDKSPTPPPPEVTIQGTSQWTYEGLPVQYWQASSTYTKDVSLHCGGVSPASIKLRLGPSSERLDLGFIEQPMTQDTTTPNLWQATFDPFFPHHGITPLTFFVTCADGTTEVQDGGSIYIDPSGNVFDQCTGAPIADATVTILQEFPPTTGNYVTAPSSTPPIKPATNPQTTDAFGHYGWDVVPGKYEVMVEKAGYIMQTTAPVEVILTPVTNLDIHLTPVAGCEVFNQFDPATKNVLVFGSDSLTGLSNNPISPTSVVPINPINDDEKDNDGKQHESKDKNNDHNGNDENHDKAELRTYNINDVGGNNIITIVEKVKTTEHEMVVSIVSIQYNNGQVITPSTNKQSFEWSVKKDGTLKELDQEMKIGKGHSKTEVSADFDAKKNKTVIETNDVKTTLSGLVLLRMATDNGALKIEH